MSNSILHFDVVQAAGPLQHFTRLMETPYGYTKFHFNRIHTAEGMQYHISRKPVHKKAYHLQTAPVLGHWHLTPVTKCPLWTKVLEHNFQEAIMES